MSFSVDLSAASADDIRTVQDSDTAAVVGSGNVRVLGTPVLLAWMEATTVTALGDRLPEGMTSVGHRIELQHLVATPVGQDVHLSARVVAQSDRSVTFDVTAQSPGGTSVGIATVERVLVDLARFELRAGVSPR